MPGSRAHSLLRRVGVTAAGGGGQQALNPFGTTATATAALELHARGSLGVMATDASGTDATTLTGRQGLAASTTASGADAVALQAFDPGAVEPLDTAGNGVGSVVFGARAALALSSTADADTDVVLGGALEPPALLTGGRSLVVRGRGRARSADAPDRQFVIRMPRDGDSPAQAEKRSLALSGDEEEELMIVLALLADTGAFA